MKSVILLLSVLTVVYGITMPNANIPGVPSFPQDPKIKSCIYGFAIYNTTSCNHATVDPILKKCSEDDICSKHCKTFITEEMKSASDKDKATLCGLKFNNLNTIVCDLYAEKLSKLGDGQEEPAFLGCAAPALATMSG